jgi:hypothetical protein
MFRLSRHATPPQLGSAAIRMRRLRQRRAKVRPLTGYARLTRRAALSLRRAMIDRRTDRYGAGVTDAILRAMHALVVAGDDFPDRTLRPLLRQYRPPEHPVAYLNRLIGPRIGRPVELALPRRRKRQGYAQAVHRGG